MGRDRAELDAARHDGLYHLDHGIAEDIVDLSSAARVTNPSKTDGTLAPRIFVADVIYSTDLGITFRPILRLETEPCRESPIMRMPVLSYFLIVGTALFGVLTLVSNRIEPKPLPVTQTIGLPPPYKAPPEVNAAPNAVNFAAESRYSNPVR